MTEAEIRRQVEAEIVAWLDSQAEKGEAACTAAKQGSRRQRDLAAGIVVIRGVRDNIISGEYHYPDIPRMKLGPIGKE